MDNVEEIDYSTTPTTWKDIINNLMGGLFVLGIIFIFSQCCVKIAESKNKPTTQEKACPK